MSSTQKKCFQNTVLVVEDDPDLREALVDTLILHKVDVIEAENAESALTLLAAHHDIALIISDVNMGKMSGHDLLRQVKQDYAHIPMVLITAYASIGESVKAMKEGAVDYLVKPFPPATLVDTVNKYLGGISHKTDAPIANASSSIELLQLARRVAQTDSTVLLIGESGTGKEVLAKYIHDHSDRAEQPFVAINCAAIPENMLEAMLFGHEKGAYTGAHSSAPGKFEQANGGTLLLDEISEMDMGLQAKLLRVLQEREVERLGGRKNIKLNVRVIATSNRDMKMQVAQQKFREDLYFRLSVLPLQWAPLRDRGDDIIPLAEALLSRHATKQHRGDVRLSTLAKSTLLMYNWPGNVRELDNVMQRALILQAGDEIDAADLGLTNDVSYSAKPSLVDNVALITQNSVMQQAMAHAGNELPTNLFNAAVGPDSANNSEAPLNNDMRKHEFDIILNTLRKVGGSKKNAAEALGISPRTLRYKLARLREEGFSLASL